MMGRVAIRMRQFFCGLSNHDALLHFEEGRLSLVCATCGHETPGWDLENAPARSERTAAVARPVVRLPLLGERRVA